MCPLLFDCSRVADGKGDANQQNEGRGIDALKIEPEGIDKDRVGDLEEVEIVDKMVDHHQHNGDAAQGIYLPEGPAAFGLHIPRSQPVEKRSGQIRLFQGSKSLIMFLVQVSKSGK